jgi:hypothetical protein
MTVETNTGADGKGTPTPPAGGAETPPPAAPPAAPAEGKEEKVESLLGEEPEASKDEQPPSEKPVETDIEVKFPEGVKPDEEMLKEFLPLAKELKLDSKSAQRVADLGVKMMQKSQAAMMEAFQKQRADWAKEVRTDKDLGGPNFDKSVKLARDTMKKFGGAELSKQLVDLGLDNNPTLVRFFVNVGKALSEDTVSGASAGAGRSAVSEEEQQLRNRYPSMYKDKE